MLYPVIGVLFVQCAFAAIDSPNVAFKWKSVDFVFPNDQVKFEAIRLQKYIPENNLPLGLEVYEDRIFITLPRWKNGVAASLAYIKKSDPQDSPLLRPYPNWAAHDQDVPNPEIVSPFRIRSDNCGRLWILDSGVVDIIQSPKQVIKPRLVIYDVKTDKMIRSYTIPDDQLHSNSFFANLVLEENGCDDTFAYVADLGHPSLVVYDFKNNKSWMFKHHYFNLDPLAGALNVSGVAFEWSDGIFGLAISDKDSEGYSTLYFHPMISFNEFTVSTKTLRNESLAKDPVAAKDHFKLLGTRGPKTQSGTSFLHKKTGVLFYSLIQLNAVACWNTSLPNYTMESQGRVFLNDEIMVFPNDLKVDANDNLWVLTDKLPKFMYDFLNYDEYNFRIINATVKEAIKGTTCDSTMVVDRHIMKNISSAGIMISGFNLVPVLYLLIRAFS